MDSYDLFRFILQLLFIILIVLGSLLILWVIHVTKQYQTPSGLLIGNLALTDLLVGGFVLPFGIPAIYFGNWASGRKLCVLCAYANHLLSSVAILTLMAISFDRYVAIIHAIRYHQLMTLRRIALIIIIVWIMGIISAILPLLGWGRFIYQHGASLCVTDFKTNKPFTFFVFSAQFGVPLNAIFIIYIRIFMVVTKQAKAIRNTMQKVQTNQSTESPVNQQSLDLSTNRNSPLSQAANQSEAEVSTANQNGTRKLTKSTIPRRKSLLNKMKMESKAAVTMFVIIGVFVLSISPFAVYSLYCLHTGESYETADFITTKIAYSNAILNPLVYGLMNKLYRKGIFQIFHMIFRCKKRPDDFKRRSAQSTSFSN
ncbi:alpha-1B adrenergic receptor-like [Dendronephthya gigantea]|uniref:alpha-1B adrenergic receptor-like n=1 Tax=Dendronephthya gigantea TaxID=151771 RepID=UPI00106C8F33|nr:alpha-1B adrenergic receptor-like [Dendronephthya gigantea]